MHIDPDDFDFELPPGAVGTDIVDYIDIGALAALSGSNALYTFSLNVSRELDQLAIINATALRDGITETSSFSLLDTDDYASEAELVMAILMSVTHLQTGSVAVVELNYFGLTYPPFGTALPTGPDAAIQWEPADIANLLGILRVKVKEYFDLVAENGR